MNKKIKAFSMVGTIVLLIVSAIAIVSLTPMVTRKIVNVEIGKSAHGRFEAYKKNGKAYYKICGTRVCMPEKECPGGKCVFTPPKNVKNIVIHAVGGGGAGGSAGAISTASYKTQTIEQIFDIRPDAKSADGEISAVDGTVLNDYIHTFPNEMFKKTTELGTITQAPKYENMKPWFTFDKLQEKYKFVFGVACGGKGGFGGDAVIKTNKDPECWKDWNKGCVMSQAPNQQSSSCCASSHSENFPTPHSVCDSYSKKWTTTCYYSLRQCCSALYNGNNESCVPNDKITTTGICNNQQGSCEENINKDGCVWKGETYTVTTPGGEGGDKPPCVYTATPLNNFAYIYKVKVSDYTGNDPTPPKAKTTTATLE